MANVGAVHNVDQRARIVRFEHTALGSLSPIECEQHGSDSQAFVSGTSSVIWPVALLLAKHLCDHPELVRGKACIELGAGIGIVGMVAAALGASRVVVTDLPEAMPILERNAACMTKRLAAANKVCSISAAPLPWGDEESIANVGLHEFDTVVAADVLIGGWAHTHRALAETMLALLRHGTESRVLVAYEYREEWETVADFQDLVKSLGLCMASEQLDEGPELDDDFFLYTLWRDASSSVGHTCVA
mmetsp:Transcript_27789/g.84830  ORF Transcript_27789/g.84830 Transcript_27789/m.84830 type:complete len:246 (+) Transcript_27789:113-850(+)